MRQAHGCKKKDRTFNENFAGRKHFVFKDARQH